MLTVSDTNAIGKGKTGAKGGGKGKGGFNGAALDMRRMGATVQASAPTERANQANMEARKEEPKEEAKE